MLVAQCGPVAGWLQAEEIEKPERRDPIVFEFVEPSPGPEADDVPETDLVSTKRSVARTETPAAEAGNDLPFSEGESPVKEFRPATQPMEREPTPPGERADSEPVEGEGRRPKQSAFSPSAMRKTISQTLEDPKRFDNRQGSAAPPGDLSFNTVDFEFAPYLLILKRRIEEKWYPPVAFRGGLPYRGASVIRFAVEKSGELGLLEVVSEADHPSLDTAALNAIRFGAPFPPLPDDFPEEEERWVITCTFYYR